MEKLLETFASGLLILSQEDEKRTTKPASEEQKVEFKEALKEHLNAATEHREAGFVLTYDYTQGKIRGGMRAPHESTVESANGNLQAVFNKLPSLPEGETYAFPVPTSVSFEVVVKPWEKVTYVPKGSCQWIQSKM